MLNIATCLAEQQPPPTVPGSKLSLLADARVWAKKTIAVIESLPPEEDTQFCKEVIVHAMITLAEIARTARIAREGGASMGGGWRGGLLRVGTDKMRVNEMKEVWSGKMERVQSGGPEEVRSRGTEGVRSGEIYGVRLGEIEGLRPRETEEEWDRDEDEDEIGASEAEERHWFEQALRLSKKIGYEHGVQTAVVGLRDLENKE